MIQVIEATVIGVTLVGIAWLASWRLARPRPREDATYRDPYGDIARITDFHETPFNRGGQYHHDA